MLEQQKVRVKMAVPSVPWRLDSAPGPVYIPGTGGVMGEGIRRPPTHRAGKRRARILFAAGGLVLMSFLPALAQRAPDFTLKDLSGRAHKLSGYFPEHVVLLNFWATWCVPCVKELPYLQKFQDLYGPKGLQVLTINVDGPDRLATVSGFLARYGYTLPVLLDTESRVVSVYDPRLNLPYSVLLDRQGTIRYAHLGYSPGDERLLEERIAALLQEPEVKPKSKTSVQANESFLLRLPNEGSAGSNPDSGYNEVLDQLDLTVSNGGFQAGARADLNLDLSPLNAGLRLAKRYAQYSATGFRARAGDFYTSLGRGLVFSMTKVFEEEGLDYVVDTTVDGGEVSAAAGPLSGGVFGGWIDRPEDHTVRDKVIGGNVGWTRAGFGTFRVQGASAELEPGAAFGNRIVNQGSASLEMTALGGWADLYGEFSLIRRTVYDAEAPLDGHGLYLGSKLRQGRFTLLLEMKDYRQLNFEYARPPLLESEQLEILADQFDLDRTDITSYSAHVDYYAPASATLLYAKLLCVNDNPDDHPLYGSYDRDIGHVFAGLEKKYAGGGYVNGLAGWRWETATSVAFLSTAGRTFHDQINADWPLGHGWSLEGDWKHKVFDGAGYDYYEIRSGLSLHRSPRWVLSALYERSTEPAMVALYDRKDWWAGQIEFRSGGGHSLRLFVGSTKGGMKCAGGVCRLFPPFEGIRLEAFMRF
jgi:thiol-disulfide isomerase/thioredoxin